IHYPVTGVDILSLLTIVPSLSDGSTLSLHDALPIWKPPSGRSGPVNGVQFPAAEEAFRSSIRRGPAGSRPEDRKTVRRSRMTGSVNVPSPSSTVAWANAKLTGIVRVAGSAAAARIAGR